MSTQKELTGFVTVKGARQHNLENVDLRIPRDALVVFTGVSGSKSSLAYGILYAQAQRRYLDSVAPYARRLFEQAGIPEVDSIEGLPPAGALQQQRGSPTSDRPSAALRQSFRDRTLGASLCAGIEQAHSPRSPRAPNRFWRVDETSVRVAGAWTYLYRAVHSAGDTIDFMLPPKRDAVAAKHFLQLAL